MNKNYCNLKTKATLIGIACMVNVSILTADGDATEASRSEAKMATFGEATSQDIETRTATLESAVKKLSNFKVSGVIQAQYQHAQWAADGYNFKLQNRLNNVESAENLDFGRFGVRRGRIKFTYESGLMQAVFQPDFSQAGVSFKDAYFAVKDPWFGTNVLTAGLFNSPFGFEVSFSSANRESPERSRIIQTLFADVRELGAMLTLQPAKSSPLSFLKLDAGLFSGNGMSPQISSRMDFAGRLSMAKPVGTNATLGLGVSGYFGGVLQNDESVYVMKDKVFRLREPATPNNIGKYAKKQYFGADAQFGVVSSLGNTHLRAEYVIGEHPFAGGVNAKLTALRTGPVYMRKISGGYIVLAQDLGKAPLTLVAKYDWYNPNTEVSGNDIAKAVSAEQGQTATGAGDITKHTGGFGLLWHLNPSLKLTAFYEIVKNETTENMKDITHATTAKITSYGYENDRKDNVFTLRLQYKF
jgi:phosphate-selective porin